MRSSHRCLSCVICFRRRGPAAGERGRHSGRTASWRWSRGGVRGREAEIALLCESDGAAGAQSTVGRGYGDVRVLVLGWLHPTSQTDLQAVWCTFHSHVVRNHMELPLLPTLLHGPFVQESREADAQAEIQVRRILWCRRESKGQGRWNSTHPWTHCFFVFWLRSSVASILISLISDTSSIAAFLCPGAQLCQAFRLQGPAPACTSTLGLIIRPYAYMRTILNSRSAKDPHTQTETQCIYTN